MTLARQIDTIIAEAIERRVFPGAVVLIARANEIRHFAAYGSTIYDTAGSQPVTRDTIYDIASLTKVFTATAALCLLDQGLLDLHAPAAAYIPELRATGVMVSHLLTHASGLDIRLSALREAGRDGLLAAVYAAAPARPPGTTVAYTNANSLLLGEIVARQCGISLDAALRALVIDPLGLLDTRFCPPDGLRPRIAPTEIDESWRGGLVHGSVHDESAHALGGIAGHAGLFSTAEDLFAFCRMWLNGESVVSSRWPVVADSGTTGTNHGPRTTDHGPVMLLRQETIALATINHTAGLALACGLGWMLDRPNFMGRAPPGSFGHTGFTGPALIVAPREQLVVVVLSNRVYPRRRPPPFEHHAVTAAIVEAALAEI